MLEIKKEKVGRKLLSEPCWIELSDDVRVRVDYLTRAQETELRKLRVDWQYHHPNPDNDHWIEYYVRAAVKEVQGFQIEGKPAKLEVKNGLAGDLIAGEDGLDFIHTIAAYGMLEALFGLIYERLKMTELEKKTFASPLNSLKVAS